MNTSRDRVIRTLNHEPVDRVPRELWATAATESLRADELAEMSFRYPSDIVRPDFQYPRHRHGRGNPRDAKTHTDAWGCTWDVSRRAGPPQLKTSPLADSSRIAEYRPPLHLLDGSKPDGVDRFCAAASQFVLARTETRPFERLKWLRGSEAATVDLTTGTKAARDLLAMLHDFSCREMEFWAATGVDGVVFRDDWGSDRGLVLPRALWRDLFKPLYRDYCRILHANDKFAFFQSGGDITEIFGELVELGVDAIHSQLFAMDFEDLARRFRGKVTFWGEIDRVRVLQFGTPDDVRAAVDRVRKALDFGRGGVIAQCEWDHATPFENVAEVFKHWLEPVLAHA